MAGIIQIEPEICKLKVTSLGQRAGTEIETASLNQAIRRQLKILEKGEEKGRRRVEDFNLVVNGVGLVLETTLIGSLRISLAIGAVNILDIWVDVFGGSRDISATISCEEIMLAELRVEFLNGLEATCCSLPMNITTMR